VTNVIPAWAVDRLRQAARDPWRLAAGLVAWVTLVATVSIVVGPFFASLRTYGFHDWDAETSFRYLTKTSLLRYGEFPGWNPYACGGYPAWGYVEGSTTLVSPWLPAYLALPLPLALRVETAGMALLGAVGAYVLGSAFTRSHAARLLVAALWAVNGRWGLQAASGHTWHLAYAWLPWCLYFYERARQQSARFGSVIGCGVCFALLVYAGGIYPLPHTVLVVSVYAVACAIQERRLAPLRVLGVAGLIGVGLSAPKLLPLLDTFQGDPRLIASTEQLDLGAFVTLLTSPDQGFFSRPARVQPYGWHEWGMYISAAGLGILILAFLFVEGRRERALKALGGLLLVLGFGAFHQWAPWTWMHEHLPVFRSQHVPSRFLYPAVLVLGLVAACGIGRFVERRRRRVKWLDFALVLGVATIGVDVARVSALPMKSAMWMEAPAIPTDKAFHFEQEPPFQYKKRDWAGPVLLAMMGNVGVLNCYGVPRSPERPIAALAHDDPRYRGETYLTGPGGAELVHWTPNSALVAVSDASADATLIYNMNYRNGWRSDAGPVVDHDGLLSVRLPAGTTLVRLWYRPPGLGLGLGIAVLTAALLLAWYWRRRDAALLDDARA